MYFWIKRNIDNEKGLGTVEMVIILAVLVGIALIFRHYIFDFVHTIMTNIFGDELGSVKQNPLGSM
ncbi:MAG: hypothetical protein FNP40_16180 [Dehalobacter sp. 4CP]|mgnify:CR=1 FL=1|nr:hypothetical protein [Dehalobacter sp. 4CP]